MYDILQESILLENNLASPQMSAETFLLILYLFYLISYFNKGVNDIFFQKKVFF